MIRPEYIIPILLELGILTLIISFIVHIIYKKITKQEILKINLTKDQKESYFWIAKSQGKTIENYIKDLMEEKVQEKASHF